MYAQYNNLCQFGLLSQAYQPISPSILIHFQWELYHEAIIQHFQVKEVGATDALSGVLDDVPIEVHGMKELDYIMMLMSSYGTLTECGEEKMTLQSKWPKAGEDVQVP